MTDANDFSLKAPRVSFQRISSFKDAPVDPPENMLVDSFRLRPRSMSHHLSSNKVPSRRWLKIQANFWRSMMGMAMRFHDYAKPRAPAASFKRQIPTDTIPINLYFYLPPNYHSILRSDPDHRFPIVVNFHGGGFCLGHATDDRYWARVVLQHTPAIFVSVNYRRAPEHPFPIPVEDGVESLLYLADNAEELHLDPYNIALSGFSAGANLVFSVPLRLSYHRRFKATTGAISDSDETALHRTGSAGENTSSPSQSTTNLLLRTRSGTSTTTTNSKPPLMIKSIVAWYPLLDWTKSRSQKKRESRNPAKCLPKVFTDLFDHSYLPPPDHDGKHCSPYASPGLAPEHMLQDGLPVDIQFWLCEWDMLLREGQAFANRLEEIGKTVETKVVPMVPHAWDKSPNPFRNQAAIDALYEKSARGLRTVFESKAARPTHSAASSVREADVLRLPRRSIVPI